MVETLIPERHLPEIEKWLRDRDLPVPEVYPHIGVIEPGVAAGFLLVTDIPVGFLECFVSNPSVESKRRGEGLLAVGLELMRRADAYGIRKLLIFSSSATIKSMAVSQGFHLQMADYQLFVREKV